MGGRRRSNDQKSSNSAYGEEGQGQGTDYTIHGRKHGKGTSYGTWGRPTVVIDIVRCYGKCWSWLW